MKKVSASFKLALNLNSFEICSVTIMLLIFLIRTSTQLTIRTFISGSDSFSLAQYLELIRKAIYFYELQYYQKINNDLTLSIVIATILAIIVLSSIIISRKIQPNNKQNKISNYDNQIMYVLKIVFLLFYVYQYPLLGFSLNLTHESIKLGKYYYLPISIFLSLLIIHSILVLQALTYTLSFNCKSLLVRNRSYIKIIKAVVNMVILLYLQIKRNKQVYDIEYGVITWILILVYGFQFRNFMGNATYYIGLTRKVYLLTIIISMVLNIYLFLCLFQLNIIKQNFVLCNLVTSIFMYFAIQSIYNNRQIEILNNEVDRIAKTSIAIIYVRHAIDIIQQAKNKNKTVCMLGLLMDHKMHCKKTTCFCKRDNWMSIQLQKFVLEYFQEKIDILIDKFENDLTFMITCLNFKLQLAGSYNNYMIELKKIIQRKPKLGWNQNFMIIQSQRIFEQYITQSNSKSNIADTELVFQMSQKKEKILQILIIICKLSSQRWRMSSISYYPMRQIQRKLDAILEYIKQMQEFKNWFQQKKVKNPEFCTIFITYYSCILSIPKQKKLFVQALEISNKFLRSIDIVTTENIRQVVFGIDCCTIQSPITSNQLGIITNCTNSLNVLWIQKQYLMGKNIKMIMPQTLAIYHDEILQRWMKTGYKKSMNTVKRVFVVRGTKQKELVEAALYLKLYYNSQKKILNFITSIVKQNCSDFILINENLKIEGYGSKIAKIAPTSIVGGSFSHYNGMVSKYYLQSAQKPIKDTISIRINSKKRWKSTTVDYKYDGQYSSYQMVGKKFLLIKINELLAMETKQKETIVRRVQRRSSEIAHEKKSIDSKSRQSNKNSLSEQFQQLEQIWSSNIVYNLQYEQLQLMSSAASSTAFSYFLDNILQQCLEKSMNSKKINLGTKKYIFIFVCVLLIFLIVGNIGQSLVYEYYMDSTATILHSESHSASILILETLYCKQIINYKIAKAPFIPPSNFQTFIEISRQLKNRLFNTLTDDFRKINDKLLSGSQLHNFLKKQKPIIIGNSLVQSNFLFLSFIYHTISNQAFENKPNKLLQLQHIVHQNWQPLLEMAIQIIPQIFNQLGQNIRYTSYLLISFSILSFVLMVISIFIMIMIDNIFENKKKDILLTNSLISQKFSQQMISYYSLLKQSLEINRFQEIQQQQFNLKTSTTTNMNFQYQKNKLFIGVFLFIFAVWIIPQSVFLSQAIKSVNFIEEFNQNLFQAIQSQKSMYLTSVNFRRQMKFNGYDFEYDKLDLLNGLNTDFDVDNIFLSISKSFILKNSFQQELRSKLNEDICDLIQPYSTKSEVITCKKQINLIMFQKGIVVSTLNLQSLVSDSISVAQNKNLTLKSRSRSEFTLNFMSDYFIILGIDSLIKWSFTIFESTLQQQITISYIINVFGILFNLIVGIFWWFHLHYVRKNKQSKLLGYIILFPIQVIKQNKLIFKKFQSQIFNQL